MLFKNDYGNKFFVLSDTTRFPMGGSTATPVTPTHLQTLGGLAETDGCVWPEALQNTTNSILMALKKIQSFKRLPTSKSKLPPAGKSLVVF